MSKYFNLERIDAKTVKGVVLKDYNNEFKPFTIGVIHQNAARIRKNREGTKVIVEGSINDVFDYLPRESVRYEQKFAVYTNDNRCLRISPIILAAGQKEFLLGGLVEELEQNIRVISLDQYNEYLWLHKHGKNRSKETSIPLVRTPNIAP